MMTLEEKQRLALKFLSILGRPDIDLLKEVAVKDMIWTFPGSSAVSANCVMTPNDPKSLLAFPSRHWRRPRAVPVQRAHHSAASFGVTVLILLLAAPSAFAACGERGGRPPACRQWRDRSHGYPSTWQ
jgi:hypothetical protein